MVQAVEEFFPESDLVGENGTLAPPAPRRSMSSGADRGLPLQRVNTGISSIVGSDNGDKPGGFVLVIDGAALQDVRSAYDSRRYSRLNILFRL
jgi:phospholipid-translocating ATPase